MESLFHYSYFKEYISQSLIINPWLAGITTRSIVQEIYSHIYVYHIYIYILSTMQKAFVTDSRRVMKAVSLNLRRADTTPFHAKPSSLLLYLHIVSYLSFLITEPVLLD